MEAPLAERIRPQKLEDYISQLHLVGPNGSLTQQILSNIYTNKNYNDYTCLLYSNKGDYNQNTTLVFLSIKGDKNDI